MANGLNLCRPFPVILTTQSVLHYSHIHPFAHLSTDTQIGRQLGIKCLAQGHINLWQEEAEIEPIPQSQTFIQTVRIYLQSRPKHLK